MEEIGMNKENILVFSGDLRKELDEIRVLQESDSFEKARTNTEDWGTFLTIFCC